MMADDSFSWALVRVDVDSNDDFFDFWYQYAALGMFDTHIS